MHRSLLIFFTAILAFGEARTQNYGSIVQTSGYIQVQGSAVDTGSSFRVTNIANAELFRVLGNGNIGVGTNSPQARLAVNGDIFSKKVKVTQTGWPDYVFMNNYQLLPLSQIEDYIMLHKHLPGIVTEQEVKRDGLDLGDNQAALLKKIEELTLYLIRQEKEIQQLKDQIAGLKENMNKH